MDFLEKIKVATMVLIAIGFIALICFLIFTKGKHMEKIILTIIVLAFAAFVYERDFSLSKGDDSIDIKTPQNEVDNSKIDSLKIKSD